MRLIINMVASYLSWFLCLVIVTIPKSSHSSRFWSSIYLLFVIAIHALFSFSEFSIISLSSQRIVPSTLTEFECVEYLQLCIPVVFLLFRLLSEWKYVDVETETIRYLATISQNHQVSLLLSFALPSRSDLSLPPLPPFLSQLILNSLQQISQQISHHKISQDNAHSSSPLPPLPPSLTVDVKKMVDQMTQLEKESSRISDQLRLISVASQKNSYWIVFLIIYLGYQMVSYSEK
jgi:hypothetical protein